ncbi:MAG: NAD(P)/FAD-dependent oxidoreductase [Pseudomonadota bacterium]
MTENHCAESLFDVIVLGAGAAGLMCAITAGQRGLKVLVLDHTDKIGKKIRMSGGGYCNFTNLNTEPKNFISQNPHFCKSALKSYTPFDFLKLIEKYNIAYREKAAGQLFCVEKAKIIVDMLLQEAQEAQVKIQIQKIIQSVEKIQDIFSIKTPDQTFTARLLVVATGGYSVPTTGATGFGFELARQFDLNIIPTRAALVPFTADPDSLEQLQPLSGIGVEAHVCYEKYYFEESVLFTHRGLSGPAILQISTYWPPGKKIEIDFCPHVDLYEKLILAKKESPTVFLSTVLIYFLPKKMVSLWLEYLFTKHKTENKNLASCSHTFLLEAANLFKKWKWLPAGTEGYRTAEVTWGGVDTNELSSKTMESKKVSGLYFVGEVVDVTGQLGGFNFQWAWASGYAAGKHMPSRK